MIIGAGERVKSAARFRCRARRASVVRLIRSGSPANDVRALTSVAVLARPVRIDLLVEVLEDETRATLRALTVVDHRTQFVAILHSALLVVGEVGAEIDLREAALESLPTAAAILAHEPVSFQQD